MHPSRTSCVPTTRSISAECEWARLKKFRNVQAGSRVAFAVDIVDYEQGMEPDLPEIRTAEAYATLGRLVDGFEVIRIHPDWSSRSTRRRRPPSD